MVSLIADYEQQYAVLTAEITAEIGRLGRLPSDEKDEHIRKINNHVEEVQELLEQIGLEIREADASSKTSLKNRLQCYQAELKRLKQEFSKASKPDSETISMYESSDETRGQANLNDEQHRRLLDNSERIERSGNRLADGYRTILETEQLGTAVLQDLSHQRETLQRSRARLRETNEDIRQSNKSINRMYLRSLFEKGLLYAIGLVFLIVVCVSFYAFFY